MFSGRFGPWADRWYWPVWMWPIQTDLGRPIIKDSNKELSPIEQAACGVVNIFLS